MSPSTVDAIERWVTANDSRRLAIIVVRDVGSIPMLSEVCQRRFDLRPVRVGAALSDTLLAVKPSRRASEAERWLLGACRAADQHPLVISDIDLLFHPRLEPGSSIRLNPYELFKRASREVPLAVLWPGGFDNNVLSYAVPEHGHYRCWPSEPQVHVIRAR